MTDGLTEPLEFAFMQRAFLAAGFAAVVCAVVGTFVVLKGMTFMGDAVAHSSLAGMSVAYLFGGNVFWGALAWAVPASLAMTGISRRTNLRLDASIGIIFAGGFAVGIILMSRVNNYTADLFGLLFGNVLGVSWNEVALIGGITGGVLLLVLAFYKELLFTSYDATMSAASGVPVRFVQYLLPVLVGVTTVASLKAVGIILVLALLVTPPATAMLLARRLPGIIALSVAAGILATILGLYLSFHVDLPSGPSIVVVATGLFLLTLLFSPSKGLIRRRHPSLTPNDESAARAPG
jgi:ABC-type Mn2+/Zn2+ transport system permease subunit|tara:strand:- start:105 stop:983 length:879 start_codon:yes stop_codon:yes gene_type:complete